MKRVASFSTPVVRGCIDAIGPAPTVQWDPATRTLRLDWAEDAWLVIEVPSDQPPTKRIQPPEASMDEEEVGIVYVEETQDGGASYVLAINGEKLFFENRMEHNPYRGLGSMTKRYALNDDGTLEDRPRDLDSFASLPREDEERKLYFRLDEDGNGMSDNTTRLENVGIVFQAGTRTYKRREPVPVETVLPRRSTRAQRGGHVQRFKGAVRRRPASARRIRRIRVSREGRLSVNPSRRGARRGIKSRVHGASTARPRRVPVPRFPKRVAGRYLAEWWYGGRGFSSIAFCM